MSLSERIPERGTVDRGTLWEQCKLLTSSSLVVSRTRCRTTCCVALAPTRPPFPGPLTGSSGRRLFRGSARSLSRFRFVPAIPLDTSPSRNIGSACGVRIGGTSNDDEKSSISRFRGGPLLARSFAPFVDVDGEYSTETCPLAIPVRIYEYALTTLHQGSRLSPVPG